MKSKFKYLIKINYKKLNKKHQTQFDVLLSHPAFQKGIIQKKNNEIVVRPAVFNYLSYEFENTKQYKKNLIFTLLKQNINTQKVSIELDNIKIKDNEYDEMLRLIRF